MKTSNELLKLVRESVELADERKNVGTLGPWEAIGILKSTVNFLITHIERDQTSE